jgi:O-antigen/teichoic acid export membrane protein
MLKNFFKDSAIYTFGNMLNRGISIIMVPIYVRLLSPADYGVIDLLLLVGGFLNIVIGLEITQGFIRYYSDALSEEEKIDYSSTSFWFIITIYTVTIGLLLIFSKKLNLFYLGNNSSTIIFQLALISFYTNGIFIYLQNQLRFYFKVKSYVFISITYSIISYLATILILIYFKNGAAGLFWGMIIGYTIANFFGWYVAKENYKLKFDWKKCKEMLSFSIPLVPSGIAVILLMYTDRIAIKNLMTLGDVGIFGIAYRFAAILTLVTSSFQTALSPLIFKNYKNPDTPNEIKNIFQYFLIAALSLIGVLSIFSMEISVIFTTPKYYKASLIIPFLSFSSLFLALNMFTPGLAIIKKTKLIALINIAAAGLNLFLNYTFIPMFGLFGAGMGTLITSILVFIVNTIFNQKYYHINYQWIKVVSVFCFTGIIIVISKILENVISFKLLLEIIKLLLLGTSTYIFIITLVGKKDFKSKLQKLLSLLNLNFMLNRQNHL